MANENARELRKNQTEAEKRLWAKLRRGQLNDYHFRRQHPVGPYIVDFFCFEAGLVIELDGGQHYEPEVMAYDKKRTEYLNAEGLTVIRFDNYEVFEDMDAVLRVIFCNL